MRRRGRRSAVRQPVSYLRTRLFSMVLMLIIVGMLFTRAKDPRTWRWLVSDRPADPVLTGLPAPPPPPETVVPGPTDQDPAERTEAARLFEAVTDKTDLVPIEMPAYWRLLRWAEAQPFRELQKRSLVDIPLVKMWDNPQEFRGQPMTLQLHIRRLLDFKAPQNSANVKSVYEAWGWTDEAKSFPYVVIFSELPPGMKTGSQVDYDVEFTGYFLKLMTYTDGLERRRASPLMIGRIIDRYPTGVRPVRARGLSRADWLMMAAGALLAGGAIVIAIRSARKPRVPMIAAHDEASALDFFSGAKEPEPEPVVAAAAPENNSNPPSADPGSV